MARGCLSASQFQRKRPHGSGLGSRLSDVVYGPMLNETTGVSHGRIESSVSDFNARIIAEFRANEGVVGPPFEGAPLVLLHHTGRKSGNSNISPTMYLADEEDPAVVYVFASKGGAPTNPAWYYNLTEAGETNVEIGAETFPVKVDEVTGDERDAIFAKQAAAYPGFAEYADKTKGIRTIPVLRLTRT